MLVTSQSGGSGEVLRMIEMGLLHPPASGLTLEGDSPLARALPSLVGTGGSELAYAATRSQLITLAQHGALLEALGLDITDSLSVLHEGPLKADLSDTVAVLTQAPVAVMVAHGAAAQGAMDAAAHCLMETVRMPVLGLEAGQFRHGPFEMIQPDTAVIMLRSAGEAVVVRSLHQAGECVSFGITRIVIGASGRARVAGTIIVALKKRGGLALAFAALPVVQEIIVSAAAMRLPNTGVPQRSTKIASAEVA